MALVQEVELPETKMALLNTISIIVERLEHHVSSTSLSTDTTDVPDHTLCEQYRLITPTALGAVGRGAFDEASNLDHPCPSDKCYEGRFSDISLVISTHHPKRN